MTKPSTRRLCDRPRARGGPPRRRTGRRRNAGGDRGRSASLTGHYLSGSMQIAIARRTPRSRTGRRSAFSARSEHNLKNIDVEFPLGRHDGRDRRLRQRKIHAGQRHSLSLAGARRSTARAKSPARTSRSPGLRSSTKSSASTSRPSAARRARILPPTPASSRRFATSLPCCPNRASAATSPDASASTSTGGRCEACQGDGLNAHRDEFPAGRLRHLRRLPAARRYNHETLAGEVQRLLHRRSARAAVRRALPLLENIPQIKQKLQTLVDVGLGYIHLGQSATTLSGGEAQRIKLARELSKRQTGSTLLPARRADHRPALRRCQQAARRAAPADRSRQHASSSSSTTST